MRPGPLGVLGIVDHAVDAARRHPGFVLATIFAGSLPLALGAAVAIHLIRIHTPTDVDFLIGSVILALLSIPRAVGWGAAAIGLQRLLDDEPLDAGAAWKGAASKWSRLFAVQASPTLWSLFGLLASAGPLVMSVLASTPGRRFASTGLMVAASAAGSFIALGATIFVSRRTPALAIAATTNLPVRASVRRSLELVKGQTVRVVSLQTYLLVLQLVTWFTLAQAAPWGLGAAEKLTGTSLVEWHGVLRMGDVSYLAFTGALAFLIMEPIRCFSVGYFHQDGETRKSGADLKARIDRLSPAATLQPEEARWRG